MPDIISCEMQPVKFRVIQALPENTIDTYQIAMLYSFGLAVANRSNKSCPSVRDLGPFFFPGGREI